MNLQIYRINVKDDLYFLAEDTDIEQDADLFYKSIKEAQSNTRNSVGWVRRRDGMAFIGWNKEGIIRCRKLLHEYCIFKKEKKKKTEDNDGMFWVSSPQEVNAMRPLQEQAREYQRIYQATFDENLANFQDNGLTAQVSPEMLEYDMTLPSQTIDEIYNDRISGESVTIDGETVRSAVNRLRELIGN